MRQTQKMSDRLQRLSPFFDSDIRARGRAYFLEGRAMSQSGTSIRSKKNLNQLRFKVAGGELYSVNFDFEEVLHGILKAECNCPYYLDGFFCKHIWACCLKADKDTSKNPASPFARVSQPQELELLHARPSLQQAQEETSELDPDADSSGTQIGSSESYSSWGSLRASREKLRGAVSAERVQNLLPRRGAGPVGRQSSQSVPKEIWFALGVSDSISAQRPVIEFYASDTHWDRAKKPSKIPDDLKPVGLGRSSVALLSDPKDRELLSMLLLEPRPVDRYRTPSAASAHERYHQTYLAESVERQVVQKLLETGRFLIPAHPLDGPLQQWEILSGDLKKPHDLKLTFEQLGEDYELRGELQRGAQVVPVQDLAIAFPSGLFLTQDHRWGALRVEEHWHWVQSLQENGGTILVEDADRDHFVQALLLDTASPPIRWPKDFDWEFVEAEPVPVVQIRQSEVGTGPYWVRLDFDYLGQKVTGLSTETRVVDLDQRKVFDRNFEAENLALDDLKELGLGLPPQSKLSAFHFQMGASEFLPHVREILSWGWTVFVNDQRVRPAEDVQMGVSSGIDWFDLEGQVSFAGGLTVEMNALLKRLLDKEKLVALGDGTLGLPPEDWLQRVAPLAALGVEKGGKIRFNKTQGLILQMWLSEDPRLKADREFQALRTNVEQFQKLQPAEPGPEFQGELRNYQREGLAWLKLLSQLNLGGILADDMGLGKTVQVLALLQAEHRALRAQGQSLPTLVILPKSLLFNWKDEAARFAPDLRVLSHHGASRKKPGSHFKDYDLILMTYATARIDFELLGKMQFHYVIADEAQTIKNSDALASRVCRMMKGRHKLAMTGTPVENSIEDLFSILEFVNPGLLGSQAQARISRAAQVLQGKVKDTGGEVSALEPLARALKPFILRRKKEEVLKELPEKTEKVLRCELNEAEMDRYIKLRDAFRLSLRNEISVRGLARTKIIVLEALLRLRQAACHPGLLDPQFKDEPSSKLDTLVEQLTLVLSEGHKALVFSQFTQFLEIVRHRLQKEGIAYEYLDGKTRDRQARVKRFQEDSQVGVFLISLKAGGVGLNLTAADYVFILDPWWNPAVEAQAIDRSHRIGQKRKVIAYRLIADNTVEEKIQLLQRGKKDLAEAIINVDQGLLSKMTAQDVEMLLS